MKISLARKMWAMQWFVVLPVFFLSVFLSRLPEQTPDPTEPAPMLDGFVVAVALAAVLLMWGGKHIGAFLLRKKIADAELEVEEVLDPQDLTGAFRESPRKVRVFARPDEATQALGDIMFQWVRLRGNIASVVSVLGILATAHHHGFAFSLPFFVASGISLALIFPTEERWRRIFEEAAGAIFPDLTVPEASVSSGQRLVDDVT